MQINYDNINLRDFLNYTAPMSLQKFASSCGITEISKSIFPYERYKNVQELRETRTFPAFSEFKSSLKKPFDPNHVVEMEEIVQHKFQSGEWLHASQFYNYYAIDNTCPAISVVDGKLRFTNDGLEILKDIIFVSPHSYEVSKDHFNKSCSNMIDYLEFYNNIDADLLIRSIDVYTAGFMKDWKINIHRSLSLPGIAERLAYKKYNVNSPPIYSFGKKHGHLAQDVRR